MNKILYRPLSQLVLLSAVLFGWYRVAVPRFDDVVVLTAEDVVAVTRMQEELIGRTLSAEEVDQLVQSTAEDEMLVRDAFRMGMDRGDPRVRGYLVNAVRTVLIGRPDRAAADPTPAELAAFFEQNRERYRAAETVSFDDVLVPFGSLGPDQEVRLLDSLRAGMQPDPLVADIPLAITMAGRARSRTLLSPTLGREFVGRLFTLQTGSWEGPFSSSQGNHFVRVIERRPSRLYSYEEVQDYLEEDWRADRTRATVSDEMPAVRKRYDVRIEGNVRNR